MMNETIASTPASGTWNARNSTRRMTRLERLRQERRVDRAVQHAADVRLERRAAARRSAAESWTAMIRADPLGVDQHVERREDEDRRGDREALDSAS